ncbi:hypothetical protein A3L04_01800 [Thermococcus chitonophagus]|uniref:DUF1464 domain-containing protein n=1 Tax=Thermococcus chitonophagus TaxID=54262 RepID=A0A160VQL4_9EURY|nr:DUF1464 family protein [Thermococcus chitonophagus]ASJ15894.1 hypothetical protein A3L04_01800 [Thermococcus chitonophagus]CUX77135.1 hypothetical protein CHITON_0356 [Thermococcus chitonophagus]
MVKAVGIDSGTKSMDIFGFDDETNEVIIDVAVDRNEVTRNPRIIIDILRQVQEEHGKIDAIVGPCGYGIPLKPAREATDEEIALATFITRADVERRLKIVGLRELMVLMREAQDLNIYFTPGVIHLPTVPEWRKANRIDLGTADKVFTVALSIVRHSEKEGVPYNRVNLIAVEIGFAYTSAMAVKNGQIVDAMAGTAGFPGYLGMGFMDSELAYALANALDDFGKLILFEGGSAYIAGIDPFTITPEEFVKLAKTDERVAKGYNAMVEAIVKDVFTLLPSVKPEAIYLSGRFSRIPEFFKDVKDVLEDAFSKYGFSVEVRKLESRAKAKEAAEGSAIIANGIAGGVYKELVDVLRLRESSGSIFDWVYLKEKDKLKIFERLEL